MTPDKKSLLKTSASATEVPDSSIRSSKAPNSSLEAASSPSRMGSAARSSKASNPSNELSGPSMRGNLEYYRIIMGIDPGTNVMGYGVLGIK